MTNLVNWYHVLPDPQPDVEPWAVVRRRARMRNANGDVVSRHRTRAVATMTARELNRLVRETERS